MKKVRKTLLWLVAVLFVAAFAGCGQSEADKPMKEFVSSNGTVSIMLAEDWVTEDAGVDGWIAATSKNGNDGVMLMQLVKGVDAADISDIKDAMEDTYAISDKTEMDSAGALPGLENLEVYSSKISVDGTKGEGYFVYGETDYAYYAFVYVSNRLNDKTMEYVRKVSDSFKENAPEVVNNSTVETTDTILWINGTYAVLTAVNSQDYTVFGTMPANDETMASQQAMLSEWWDITDRASADETLDWLMNEGHRADFVEEMEMLKEVGLADLSAEERAGFLSDNYDFTEEEAQQYAQLYNSYEENGMNVMSGWDYSRMASVLSSCYIAGYYTETEALDKALEAAKVIQQNFDSWDSFIESYMVGYEYWAGESSEERRGIYEDLKAAPDSPYSLDWNMTLEKSW
ncbi:MAG: DUF1266 domain-containing protein [Kineothrix sp.]|nr:DUF1266 domain-containing protein [Kineothrix sp.]